MDANKYKTNYERMLELIRRLKDADIAYYRDDNPVMSDRDYDALTDELKNLEQDTGLILSGSPTQKVSGEILEELTPVRHTRPMLSADKTKSIDDLVKFAGGRDVILSWKMDGLTLVLRYNNGLLEQAITRGREGIIGEDVTHTVRTFMNVPLSIPSRAQFEVRGEGVISWENFEKINLSLDEPYRSPRNLAAGSVRKLDAAEAGKRHLEFFNTHPYLASPILGVTLALEEERANGAKVDDAAIQGVKVGMMGPLAGVGDPVFWFTVRPMLGALGASLAMGGSILGPILFFVLWNVIRWAFMWYTQEFGYKAGSKISEDLSGGLLQKVTKTASILGMFVLGSLVERWVTINFTPVVSKVQLSEGAYIDWESLPAGAEGIRTALEQFSSGLSLSPEQITTLQDNLNSLIPGFAPLLLTLLCMWLLKKNVSPIIIIIGLFIVGIVGHVIGLL